MIFSTFFSKIFKFCEIINFAKYHTQHTDCQMLRYLCLLFAFNINHHVRELDYNFSDL